MVLVGDDPASKTYVGSKSRGLVEVGMRPFDHHLPASTSETELLTLISVLNADAAVSGILVQLPLPSQINPARVFASIDPDKDVDGFHPINAGRLMTGLPALVPCTPVACLKLIKTVHTSVAGIDALMIGRSHIVGNPLAQILLSRERHRHHRAHPHAASAGPVPARRAVVRRHRLRRNTFAADWIKPGATVIDIGINRVSRRRQIPCRGRRAISPRRSRSPAPSRRCRAASDR